MCWPHHPSSMPFHTFISEEKHPMLKLVVVVWGCMHASCARCTATSSACAQPRLACRPPSTPTATHASTSTPSTSCCPARAPRTTPRAPAARKCVRPPTLHVHRCEGWCVPQQHRAAVCGVRGWRVGQAFVRGWSSLGCPVPHPGSSKFWQQCLRALVSPVFGSERRQQSQRSR